MLSGGDSRDALKVGEELDFLEAGGGQEIGDGRGLTVANFESDEAARDEAGEGLRDESAVDVETVGACEEGHGRLMVADFYGERGAVGLWDVRRVGDYDFEFLVCYRGEEIALQKADAVSETYAFSVSARQSQRGRGKIDCCDCGIGPIVCECNRNCTRARAYVDQARSWKYGTEVDDLLD